MEKRRIWGLFALLAVTAATVCGARPWLTEQADTPAEDAAYRELLAATPAAELEGEVVSPDGRLEARTVGKSDLYVSGAAVPEAIQIVDRETGEVKWEDQGYLWQSVSWSPGSDLVALAYGGRTWTAVKVLSTAWWTGWDFTLPDGSPIPEYTFLPEDWGEWLDAETLLLTVGRGGDGEEQHTYRCVVYAGEEATAGSAMEQTVETLPGDYDFDHDGVPETVELTTLWEGERDRRYSASYELRVRNGAGESLWQMEFADAHAGWGSLFALTLDDRDCLLWYQPWMGQGAGCYRYQLFSLENGGTVLGDGLAAFDVNFGSFAHRAYDPAAIAAFLREVHGYLDGSTLLHEKSGCPNGQPLFGTFVTSR